MAGAEPPPCFACQTCGLHSEGSWRPHAGRAPYPPLPVELMTAFNRGYLSNGCIRQRALYDWVPQFCTLASYDHAATCRLLHGRSILLVGDSTMEQLFAAFVLLLRGRAGRPWMMKDVTASACGDTVRLNFVRNDLSLWLDAGDASGTHVSRCNPTTLAGSHFACRAADADVVVFGVGQHRTAAVSQLVGAPAHAEKALDSVASDFFFHSFNHTLATSRARREAWGAPASSVVVMGPHMPVPGCSEFGAPITAAEALSTYAQRSTLYGDSWRLNHQLNAIARALAQDAGAWFVDLTGPSLQRPDAAKGYNESKRTTAEDCVHYCLPGPPDEWARMLVQLLHVGQKRVFTQRAPSEMFLLNGSEWHGKYGAANARLEVEGCGLCGHHEADDMGSRHHTACTASARRNTTERLRDSWWWPPFDSCGAKAKA